MINKTSNLTLEPSSLRLKGMIVPSKTLTNEEITILIKRMKISVGSPEELIEQGFDASHFPNLWDYDYEY